MFWCGRCYCYGFESSSPVLLPGTLLNFSCHLCLSFLFVFLLFFSLSYCWFFFFNFLISLTCLPLLFTLSSYFLPPRVSPASVPWFCVSSDVIVMASSLARLSSFLVPYS